VKRAQEWLHSLGHPECLHRGPHLLRPVLFFGGQSGRARAAGTALGRRAAALAHSFSAVASEGRAEELRRFYGLFPPLEKLPDELERVYALARAAKIELLQGEYRLEKPPFGMAFYRITLPIRGTYPQIRQFVAATLKSMPIASLDALRFERKKAGDPQLEAQLRLTVYFRPANEGETP